MELRKIDLLKHKDVAYFSHDSNARNDIKSIRLRLKFGWAGYGIFWAIIEILRDASDFKWRRNETSSIAMQLQETPELIKTIVAYCIKVGLFDADRQYFWSNSLTNRMAMKERISGIRSEHGRKGGNIRAERLKQARERGTHTPKEWHEMLVFFDHTCVRCGSIDSITKDHIIPIYQNGSDLINNIQPLCKTCNASKGSETIDFRITYCEAKGKQMPQIWLSKTKQYNINKDNIKEGNIICNQNPPTPPPSNPDYRHSIKESPYRVFEVFEIQARQDSEIMAMKPDLKFYHSYCVTKYIADNWGSFDFFYEIKKYILQKKQDKNFKTQPLENIHNISFPNSD